ncbi:LIC12162 family transferase [Herbaspirillum seropedicae]|uniref:LIC12162 family transferase n=1 Tax=Herbaspirillum seropedicae TaxID=964 RepID=UPI000847E22F|nr:LIC12162 family protein [Herbaspirillum seropedicae]AON56555.1 LIC12162 family transferase [Herbaspirillum seropedicae]
MLQYCLVTTALHSAWDEKKPNLLLGEWVRPYDLRHAWSQARMCEALVVSAEERTGQFHQLQMLAKRLLDDVAAALNRMHGTGHSSRYWRILLGHWLQRYLSILFNRHATLRSALERYPISHSRVLDVANFDFSTGDTGELIGAANDPRWNHFLYARLLRELFEIRLETICETTGVPGEADKSDALRASETVPPERPAAARRLRTTARKLLAAASKRLTRDTDALIINSYLPPRQEILLFAALGQVPQKWDIRSLPRWPADPALRARLKALLPDGGEPFEQLARAWLPDFLPRCFLEGYSALTSMAEQLPWPRRPRFIFTSNNFDSDELFKVWTAAQVEQGRPYIVGQHGAGYGTHQFFQTRFAPEHSASDRFLTWGWRDDDQRNVPAFLLKTAGRKPLPRPTADADRMLLVAPVVANQITHWDSIHEFACNQEFQFNWVRALPPELRKKITVRLHHGAAHKNWRDVERWADAVPGIPVDTGTAPLEAQLGRVRLVVFAYDSTGMLEFMDLDRPSIGLWYGGLDHLLPEVRDDYLALVDAGLIHLDPESAAAWTVRHWDDIPGWWDSPVVSHARKAFSHKYARRDETPVRTLRHLLLAANSSGRVA